MRRQALLSNMPIGDPGLPGQMNEGDIIGGPQEDISSKEGYSELAGYDIYYTYKYDYNENIALNIKPTKATVDNTGEVITDYDLLNNMLHDNEEQIKDDIERSEEGSKLERQPDFGQPEYDPVDSLDF